MRRLIAIAVLVAGTALATIACAAEDPGQAAFGEPENAAGSVVSSAAVASTVATTGTALAQTGAAGKSPASAAVPPGGDPATGAPPVPTTGGQSVTNQPPPPQPADNLDAACLMAALRANTLELRLEINLGVLDDPLSTSQQRSAAAANIASGLRDYASILRDLASTTRNPSFVTTANSAAAAVTDAANRVQAAAGAVDPIKDAVADAIYDGVQPMLELSVRA